MLPSGFPAHILPPSIDSCWLGFRGHSPSRAIRSLPFPLRELHPLAWQRSSVRSECSAAPLEREHVQDLIAAELERRAEAAEAKLAAIRDLVEAGWPGLRQIWRTA